MIEQPPKVQLTSKILHLLDDQNILDIIREINDRYDYWDKVKYRKLPDGLTSEELWGAVKLHRRMNYKAIRDGNSVFRFFLTDKMLQALHFFDMNIGGNLATGEIIPEEDKDRYLINSIMEEAIASSQIEGASTTRKQAKEMLRKEISPRNKSEQMIVNNYITIKHIVQNKTSELTPEKLLEIHYLITQKTLDDPQDVGKFRDNDNIFVIDHVNSEIVHTPPSYKEIPERILSLCEFFNYNHEGSFIHPIVKGIIIHFFIAYIHPFCDGNGRTARALFYWYLLKEGYWLTEYLSISKVIYKKKVAYEKAFLHTETDENDLSYFIAYNLDVMKEAFGDLKVYIRKKIDERQQITELSRIPYVNNRQVAILQLYIHSPKSILTVKEVENRFAVSNFTARTDLQGLVKMGFITAIAVNKVKNNYVRSSHFEEILKKYTL